MMTLKLIKTYCLPRLLYGCEIWPIETVDMHGLDVIWNNGFRHIFHCCWRESVKPLQFLASQSFLIAERQLMFFSKVQRIDNIVLQTLIRVPMVKYEMLGLAPKYGLNDVSEGLSTIRHTV